MTDKTPMDKAEKPVNTPTTFASSTDMSREPAPKSRALPQANELKERFKAGSIPLQTDFADLIDLANVGRQAVGGAAGQTGPANGFTLSSMGLLELKPNPNKGISVAQDGVAIKLKTISGLTMDQNGIAVKLKVDKGLELNDSEGISIKPGNGISVDRDGVTVKVEGNKGLEVTKNGVCIKTGNGIKVNDSGVNIKLAKGAQNNGGEGQGIDGFTSIGSAGGLALSSNGLSVDAGNGIQIDPKGVSIKLAENSGLSADEKNGLGLLPEQQFQKGMIMMFSGKAAPKGWALCDGSNGTPNLLDRFILGGKFGDIDQKNSTTLSGNSNDKKFSITTDKSNADISVKVEPHALTVAEMPKHSHGGVIRLRWDESSRDIQWGNKYRLDADQLTGERGGGEKHSHNSTVTQNTHSHNAKIMPPYYILAFIIKL